MGTNNRGVARRRKPVRGRDFSHTLDLLHLSWDLARAFASRIAATYSGNRLRVLWSRSEATHTAEYASTDEFKSLFVRACILFHINILRVFCGLFGVQVGAFISQSVSIYARPNVTDQQPRLGSLPP